jgi:glycolate oxidase FAD binding subunit
MDASVSAQTNLSTFEADVRGIVTAQHVRAGTASDAVAGVQPRFVVEPGSEKDVAQVLKLANAGGLAVIPRGGGTKMEWGNRPARADVILSMGRLDRVIEHAWADLTVNVDAGCTVAKLQQTLAKHGQRLALDALWPERATVGGVLSTNDSGALRLRFGSLRDLVIGVTLALADGTLASSGGRVVKNVAGYDLPKLVTGALGTLGVITRAFFRLHPMAREMRTVSCVTADVHEAQRIALEIQNSKMAHSALQICCAAGERPRVDVLFEGTEAGLTAQTVQMKLMAREATLGGGEVWTARQEVCSGAGEGDFVTAKIVALPAEIAEAVEMIGNAAGSELQWRAVVQATGVGWLRISGPTDALRAALISLREWLEGRGGSLMIARRPEGIGEMDVWGNAGDALALMEAVKRQFDPARTLNPGRFAGGI